MALLSKDGLALDERFLLVAEQGHKNKRRRIGKGRRRAFGWRFRNFFRFLASAKIFRVLAVSRAFAAAGQVRVGNY